MSTIRRYQGVYPEDIHPCPPIVLPLCPSEVRFEHFSLGDSTLQPAQGVHCRQDEAQPRVVDFGSSKQCKELRGIVAAARLVKEL
jgi:hypothetical protein